MSLLIGYILSALLSLSPDQACARLIAAVPTIKQKYIDRIFKEPSTALCLENIPKEYLDHPLFFYYAFDPDPQTLSKQTLREAMAAIDLVRTQRVRGPLTRAPAGSSADFIDADGEPLDIKAPSSPRSPAGIPYSPEYWRLKILEKLVRNPRNSLTGEATKIQIYFDFTWLTNEDRELTQTYLRDHLSPEENSSIHYFELVEPIAFLRPRSRAH